MQKTSVLLSSIGKLVKISRATHMDQTELAIRAGLTRNTISAIENGKSINTESLFSVLEQLELIDDIQMFINDKLHATDDRLSRKSRKTIKELDNDF